MRPVYLQRISMRDNISQISETENENRSLSWKFYKEIQIDQSTKYTHLEDEQTEQAY